MQDTSTPPQVPSKPPFTPRHIGIVDAIVSRYRESGHSGYLLLQIETECMLGLIKAYNSYDVSHSSGASLETFLFASVKLSARKALQAHARRKYNIEIDVVEDEILNNLTDQRNSITELDKVLDDADRVQHIRKWLHKHEFDLIWDHYVNGKTYIELAAQLNVSRERIRQRIDRITRKVTTMVWASNPNIKE